MEIDGNGRDTGGGLVLAFCRWFPSESVLFIGSWENMASSVVAFRNPVPWEHHAPRNSQFWCYVNHRFMGLILDTVMSHTPRSITSHSHTCRANHIPAAANFEP